MSILQFNRVNLTQILWYLWWTGSTQLHRISLGLCSHMEILEDTTEGFAGEHPDCLRWALAAVGDLKKASPSPAHHNSLRLGTDPFTHVLPLTRGMLHALCKSSHFFSVSKPFPLRNHRLLCGSVQKYSHIYSWCGWAIVTITFSCCASVLAPPAAVVMHTASRNPPKGQQHQQFKNIQTEDLLLVLAEASEGSIICD